MYQNMFMCEENIDVQHVCVCITQYALSGTLKATHLDTLTTLQKHSTILFIFSFFLGC